MRESIERELSTNEALAKLARHVAGRLVAQELQRMVDGPVSVTVHANPARRELPPAPARRGRKPGPKPRAVAKPNAEGREYRELADRLCRKCFKRGTTQRVAGTERTVKCAACGCTWDARGLKPGVGARPATDAEVRDSAKRVMEKHGPSLAKLADTAACMRCGHAKAAHELGAGRCVGLKGKCVCSEFYA